MRKIDINDFDFRVEDGGNLYVDGDIEVNQLTFWLDEEGNLYFNDDLPWIDDYYVLQTDGYYK